MLRSVLEGTASATGKAFFRATVRNLARALDMRHAVVGRIDHETGTRMSTLAVWNGDRFEEDFEYDLANTPCDRVMRKSTCVYADDVQASFPLDLLLAEMNARSYIGTPLMLDGRTPLGVLVVVDDRPVTPDRIPLATTVLEIFAARAAAELDRRDAHYALLEQQAQLERLVEERTRALHESMTRLERGARLASLGTLASGVAHELNNPLGIIRLACESIEGDPEDEDLRRAALRQILENVDRCGVIVRNIQRFARSEKSLKAPIDVNECIRTAAHLARPRKRIPDVDFEVALAPDLPMVLGNTTELLQVFVNLLQNALAAKDVRKLRITSSRTPEGVHIEVADDGAGIAEDDLPHLFDPFFTTRLNEGGTGLGLSICHGIVREHGGQIEVRSSLGAGSAFRVDLPGCA